MKNTIFYTIIICQIFALLTVVWLPGVPWHLAVVSVLHIAAIGAFKPRWSVKSMINMIIIQTAIVLNGVLFLKLPVLWAMAPFLFSLFVGMIISVATIVAAIEKVWKRGKQDVKS